MFCKCGKVKKSESDGSFTFSIDKSRLTEKDAGEHEVIIQLTDKFTLKGKETKISIPFEIKYTPATPEPGAADTSSSNKADNITSDSNSTADLNSTVESNDTAA